MKGRPKGAKDKRTLIIERVLDQMVNQQERDMMRRFLKCCDLKSPAYWRRLAEVTERIQAQIELLDDKNAVVIVATDGTENVCLANLAVATQRIMSGSHRLGMAGDLRRPK